MRQILLATALIGLPVGLFAGFEHWLAPTAAIAAVQPSLGDLAPLKAIVADVQAIAAKGDLAGAATRITDLETAWDDDQAVMQPANPVAWGALDGLIDPALRALRAATPDAGKVTETLAALATGLDNPGGPVAGGVVQVVAGIAVSDAGGHALPCEGMIGAVRSGLAASAAADADKTKVAVLQAKATERCNADDDAHADAFSAQALALLVK